MRNQRPQLGKKGKSELTSSPTIPTGILQRKCACGEHTLAGAECSTCGKAKDRLQRKILSSESIGNSSGTHSRLIQAKLTVGQVNDPSEQEADRIADEVMGATALPALNAAPPRIQRLSRLANPDGISAPASVDTVLNSLGKPLEPVVRRDMEQRFGHDFSMVRVHTDPEAAKSASEVNANAYTVGNHIVFDSGQFALGTKGGHRLLAHELVHVLQQSDAGSQKPSQGSIKPYSRRSPSSPHKSLQRQPKSAGTPPTIAGGNVLYIGMNNYKPEVQKLGAIYTGRPVKVTTVTVTEETSTKSNGGTFDLTADAGMLGFAKTLTPDKKVADDIKTLLASQSIEDRDDLAHVISVYAMTEKDGADRMSRVVLSGHSYGTKVYNEDIKGAIYFDALVKLASIFPKAAGQTKHLLILACLAASEDNIKNTYSKAFPGLQTFWGWTSSCPTGYGAARALEKWSAITDKNPTKLETPPSGQANWAVGVYQTDAPVDPVALLSGLRADESKFNDYFAGTKVDPDNHSGFLYEYYRRARTAEQQTSAITGADAAYVKLHADQSFRLRFWPAMVSNFWKKNSAVISKGYGAGTVPKYQTLARKAVLAAIADFDSVSTATGVDRAEAKRLLNALRDLDPVELNDNWLTP